MKEQSSIHAPILDQACAALIKDMKARGLLDHTLVVWVTEFGRMPTFQKGANGRDHNPHGFSVWLTGAGVKKASAMGPGLASVGHFHRVSTGDQFCLAWKETRP